MSDFNPSEVQLAPFDLLIRAAWYVRQFEPTSTTEDMDKQALLGDIDALLPPDSPIEYCPHKDCCRPKGHEGEHDAIPF